MKKILPTKENKELVKRAQKAFSPKFRQLLEDSVLLMAKREVKFARNDCGYCPEGCLPKLIERCIRRPYIAEMMDFYGFSFDQHKDFQDAFDCSYDNKSPESALGLLYRLKLLY